MIFVAAFIFLECIQAEVRSDKCTRAPLEHKGEPLRPASLHSRNYIQDVRKGASVRGMAVINLDCPNRRNHQNRHGSFVVLGQAQGRQGALHRAEATPYLKLNPLSIHTYAKEPQPLHNPELLGVFLPL